MKTVLKLNIVELQLMVFFHTRVIVPECKNVHIQDYIFNCFNYFCNLPKSNFLIIVFMSYSMEATFFFLYIVYGFTSFVTDVGGTGQYIVRTRPKGQGQMIFVSSKCICSLTVGHNNFKLCRCIGHMM